MQTTSENFTITNKSRGSSAITELPFAEIKIAALGNKYELSLVFVDGPEMKKLNRNYREKDYATDILSFPIDELSGEILICPSIARKKATEFGRSFTNYVQFLFIHGCTHLIGFEHSSKMESEEQKIRARFAI
jgi:probable rRNA maturation factor